MTTPNTQTQSRGEFTSASNALADSLCAGRHLSQRGCADIKTEDATHGTKIHNSLAKQDPAGLDVEQVDTYEACNEIATKMVEKYFGEGATPPVIRETRCWIYWADGLRHSGQIDAVFRSGTKALILEYKTLNSDIPGSPKNMQLRDQVCLFDTCNPLLSEIAVCVIQPLATHSPELCVYQRQDINRAREQLYLRVAESNKPNAPRTAGEAQCKFCLFRLKCPEHNKWAGSMVVAQSQMDVVPDIIDRPVVEWTPQMRVVFLDRMPIAQKWLDDCKAEMKRLLAENPDAIPGYELKAGNKRETVTNPQGVFDRFSARGGTLEQFMACISVAKTKLKEQLAAVTKSKGKKLAGELEELTAGLVEVKKNEPSIERKD